MPPLEGEQENVIGVTGPEEGEDNPRVNIAQSTTGHPRKTFHTKDNVNLELDSHWKLIVCDLKSRPSVREYMLFG
jgi:hypothetical protein